MAGIQDRRAFNGGNGHQGQGEREGKGEREGQGTGQGPVSDTAKGPAASFPTLPSWTWWPTPSPTTPLDPFITADKPNPQQLDFQTLGMPQLTASSSATHASSQPSPSVSLNKFVDADRSESPITGASSQQTSPSLAPPATLSILSISTALSVAASTTTVIAPEGMTTAFDSRLIPAIVGGVLGGAVLITLLAAWFLLCLRRRRKDDRGAETAESYIQRPIMWTLRAPPIAAARGRAGNQRPHRESRNRECLPRSPATARPAVPRLVTDGTSLVANAAPPARDDIDEYLDVAMTMSPTSSIGGSETSPTSPMYEPGTPPPYVTGLAHGSDQKS